MGGILFEFIGNTGAGAFLQTGGCKSNTGVTKGLTLMVNRAIVAQKPVVGVKIYSVVVVLSKGRFQVPVIPLVDINGNGVNVFPEQMGVTALKVGTIFEFTVTVLVTSVSEQPPVPVMIYLIIAKPVAFPVISPVVAFTEAIIGFEDSHRPPKTVGIKVVELPKQIV